MRVDRQRAQLVEVLARDLEGFAGMEIGLYAQRCREIP